MKTEATSGVRWSAWLGRIINVMAGRGPLASGQWPYGRTTIRQRLQILSAPILSPVFWQRLYREVIMGLHQGCLPLISRTTRLVFLLDPGAATVWPHPRYESEPTVGTVLSHWILRLRNPRLECRALPLRGYQISKETELEFEKEIRWRWSMLVAYGDKWPNEKLSDGAHEDSELDHKA